MWVVANDEEARIRKSVANQREDLVMKEADSINVGLEPHMTDEREVRGDRWPVGITLVRRNIGPVRKNVHSRVHAKDSTVRSRADREFVGKPQKPPLKRTHANEIEHLKWPHSGERLDGESTGRLAMLEVIQVDHNAATHVSWQQAQASKALDPHDVE
jgi:hypothetical protein